MRFKNGILFALLGTAVLFSTSCSKDDDDKPAPKDPLKTVVQKNLQADPVSRNPETGEVIGGTNAYTLFRFADSTIVANSDSASDKWDIGFRGTSIILNGGISGPGAVEGQVLSNTFAAVTEAPETGYAADSESGNVFGEWYNYNMTDHTIHPKPGYVLVLHTADGKYVKVEIISYYEDAPAEPQAEDPSRYYTFRYVYQPDGSRNFTDDKQ